MSEVRLIKLVTGEEILAEIVDDATSTLTIKNPLNAVVQPDQRGGISYGFIPWAGLTDGNLTLVRDKVIFISEVREDVLNSYNTQFGNILAPSQKIIL